jgi:hypothetical protein
VLVVHGDTVKMHQQIEGDVRLQLGEGAADGTEIATHAQLVHLVAQLFEPGDHVPLGPKIRELLVRQSADVGRRHEILVHQDEYFELLPHRGKWWCPRFRYL